MIKPIITPNIVANSLSDATAQLQSYSKTITPTNPDSLKLMNEYMKWIKRKTILVETEKTFNLPYTAAPNRISKHTYDWLKPEKQAIIDKYYEYTN